MKLKEIISRYKEITQHRFDNNGHLNSCEDCIRYDFFYSVLEVQKIEPWKLILESKFPHEILALDKTGLKIDMLIRPEDNRNDGLICEFKYPKNSGNSSGGETAKYAQVINDLLRLALLKQHHPNYEVIFICLLDSDLMKYKKGFYQNHLDTGTKQIIDIEFLNALSQKTSFNNNNIKPQIYEAFKTQNISAEFELLLNHSTENLRLYVWKF
jgi:hypothetical protein